MVGSCLYFAIAPHRPLNISATNLYELKRNHINHSTNKNSFVLYEEIQKNASVKTTEPMHVSIDYQYAVSIKLNFREDKLIKIGR